MKNINCIHLFEIIGFVCQLSSLLKIGFARHRFSDCLRTLALTCKLLLKHKYLSERFDYSMSAGDGQMWSMLHSHEVHCSVVHPRAILWSDLQFTDCSNTSLKETALRWQHLARSRLSGLNCVFQFSLVMHVWRKEIQRITCSLITYLLLNTYRALDPRFNLVMFVKAKGVFLPVLPRGSFGWKKSRPFQL